MLTALVLGFVCAAGVEVVSHGQGNPVGGFVIGAILGFLWDISTKLGEKKKGK